MANIKLISVNISGDKDLVRILNSFNTLVTRPKELKTKASSKAANKVLTLAEKTLASRFGATLVNGKLGQSVVADLELPLNSPISTLLYGKVKNQYQEFLAKSLEIKASTSNEVTIGQLTITSNRRGKDPLYSLPGTTDTVSGSSFLKKLGVSGNGYLLELDERTRNLVSGADITDIVFNDYFKKDKRFRSIYYSKASSMVLSSKLEGPDPANKLLFVRFPINYFTSKFFKATKEGNAIKISIKTSFQNALINTANETHLQALQRIRPLKVDLFAGGTKASVDFLSRDVLSGTLSYGMEITNSIKARPTDTIRVRTKIQEMNSPKTSKQRFISSVQLTELTRVRLEKTMKTIGLANPPDFKNRSGRFINSVEVFANYRSNQLQYLYNPLYKHNIQYGYKPDNQIKDSIRSVAQQLFTREFAIVRR